MFVVTVKFNRPDCPGGGLLSSMACLVTISIDTKKPDTSGETRFEGEGSNILANWLASQSGMYGKFLSDRPCPSDLIGVLNRTKWIECWVSSGAEILKTKASEPKVGALP